MYGPIHLVHRIFAKKGLDPGYQKKRIEPVITEKKKFDQIGHAVLEFVIVD